MSVAHYENFPVASLLVPRRLRGAIVAIYRFARAADDIADEGDAPPARRLAELDAAVAAHRLPLAPMHALLSAFRQDVTTQRYAAFDDLLDYCRRSANPIGRLLLHLYGAATPDNERESDAICTALQLVNFWQDVASDWQRGRVYLPQEDLRRFGVSEAQIGEGRCDSAWRALMAFETGRARVLLESGRPLTRALPWRLALELAGVMAGGHRILDGIDAAQGDVFRHRPALSRGDWTAIACHALFPARRHLAAGHGAAA
jgi:squalene synthase HpnC